MSVEEINESTKLGFVSLAMAKNVNCYHCIQKLEREREGITKYIFVAITLRDKYSFENGKQLIKVMNYLHENRDKLFEHFIKIRNYHNVIDTDYNYCLRVIKEE